jgi:hypothetical protein
MEATGFWSPVAFQKPPVSITFPSSGFQIKYQVLHIQAKLSQSLLDDKEDLSPPPGIFHKPLH